MPCTEWQSIPIEKYCKCRFIQNVIPNLHNLLVFSVFCSTVRGDGETAMPAVESTSGNSSLFKVSLLCIGFSRSLCHHNILFCLTFPYLSWKAFKVSVPNLAQIFNSIIFQISGVINLNLMKYYMYLFYINHAHNL